MGMVLGITRLRDETIDRILADPPLVWKVVAPDDPDAYENSRAEADRRGKPGLFARLFGASRSSPPESTPVVEPLALVEGEGADVDLDKSWHGIHYVLTGSADAGTPPLDFLLEGGRDIGNEDLGYGTGRVFTSAETRAIADALSAVSDAEIRARFDARAMSDANVYLDKFWIRGETSDEPLEYLMAHVTTLRDTLTEAVSRKHGMLISLS